jgi:hypothetical protein
LLHSLQQYAAGERFQPTQELTVEAIEKMQ